MIAPATASLELPIVHSTTNRPGSPSPVELCMRSVLNATGLGIRAGVVVLCRFPVTLSAQSRGFAPSTRSNHRLRRPAGAPTHPLSLLPFTEKTARHSREG